jgi:transposase
VRAIARELGVARNTVRRYVRGTPEAKPRLRRGSKLDAYKEQVRRWVSEDHLLNCETMLVRLQALGYTGRISILKDFVRPLRPPAAAARRPIIRYEAQPGEQLQFDWGEFVYEQDGQTRKLFGFTAVLSYSRMRFVTFVKRTDAPTLIRCLVAAFEAFGGLPRAVLTDRMKTVLLDMQTGQPHWHPRFQELVSALGISPRVCRSYTPQTKGKVERSVGCDQTCLLAGGALHLSGRPEPPGGALVSAGECARARHDAPAPGGPLGRGGVARGVSGLGLGAVHQRGAAGQLGWVRLLRRGPLRASQ